MGPDNSGEDSDEDRLDGDLDLDRGMMDDDMTSGTSSEVTIGPDGKKKRSVHYGLERPDSETSRFLLSYKLGSKRSEQASQ